MLMEPHEVSALFGGSMSVGVTQDVHLNTCRFLTFCFWEFRTGWLESAVWRQISSRPPCNILKVAYGLRQCTFDYLFTLMVVCGFCSF